MLDLYRNYQFKINEKIAMQIRSLHINFTYRIYHITPCTRADLIWLIHSILYRDTTYWIMDGNGTVDFLSYKKTDDCHHNTLLTDAWTIKSTRKGVNNVMHELHDYFRVNEWYANRLQSFY